MNDFVVEQDRQPLFDIEPVADTLIVTARNNIGSLAEQRVQREFGQILRAVERQPNLHVVLDMNRVSHFGAAMLEAMRVVGREVRGRQGQLAICNLSRTARKIMHVSGLEPLWPVHATRQTACQAVAELD